MWEILIIIFIAPLHFVARQHILNNIIVYVIAQEGVKFGINFTSCSENGNEITRGVAECYFAVIAKRVEFIPKFSLLPVL